MESILQHSFFTPGLVLYIMMGFMVASRVHFGMLERKNKYKIHHFVLAIVFNFTLWPLKLVQLFFVWLFSLVQDDRM